MSVSETHFASPAYNADYFLAEMYESIQNEDSLDFNFFFSSRYIPDFFSPEAANFYQRVRHTFYQPPFDQLKESSFKYPRQYIEFCAIRKHDYETMRKLCHRRLIVSLTTYPKRIHLISQVLESIYQQTRKADEVILWLAEEQFPKKEKELPQELLVLEQDKKLTIRWCDDLKPHKKYFYAFQEYPNDLIITIDDDLLYSPYLLSSLYASYLLYPQAISTVRAHLILADENQKILPYDTWIQETDACIYTPSMQLMATNGAGVLHPPELYCKETFDKATILENCLWADDIWLKAMQLVSDIPVVVAKSFEPLNYVPNSQEEGLFSYNVQQHKNDEQLEKVSRWLDAIFYPGILSQKISQQIEGKSLMGLLPVSNHLNTERKNARSRQFQVYKKWKQAESQKKTEEHRANQNEKKLLQKSQDLIQAQIQIAQLQEAKKQLENQTLKLEQQKKDLALALTQTQQKLDQSEKKYKKAEADLRWQRENAPISRQLKNLGSQIRARREDGEKLLPWSIKYAVYLLAWMPEKILAVMMYYLRNGAKHTLKQAWKKLLRKG